MWPTSRSPAMLIVILTLSFLVVPLAAEAQQATKVYRIGWLSAGPPPPMPTVQMQAFQQGLRDLGYVEGQNLVLEYRYGEGSAERLREVAAELVQLPVDVIVAVGASGTRGAQRATRTIPIVMTGNYDPVGEGFVASLARPGGNITGLSNLRAELIGKQLEFLKATVPQSTRIAVLANPASPGYASLLHNLTKAAEALKLSLHVVELRRAEELDDAFAAMLRASADTLVVFSEPQLITPHRGRIADLAATSRLPAMYDNKTYVEAGGLMSYGANPLDTNRRVAVYVDKILKGAKPADLPVEQPTTFELVINLKTAQALGLTIPPSLLFQADEILREAER
jgi:putative tryptophan/tyrosine transport system substrate-binding protein